MQGPLHRPIRRKDRAMAQEEALALLEKGTYGVLSVVAPDGEPYGVPLSYIYGEGAVYIHCAHEGLKVDCLRAQARCSFTVVADVQAFYLSQDFTTAYRSVIVQGRAVEITQEDEKRRWLSALCAKYVPAHAQDIPAALDKSIRATGMWRIDIERISGKARPFTPTA